MKSFGKLLAVSLFLMFASCSNDDDRPVVINEEEVITTVKLLVSENGTTNTQNVIWKQGVNNSNNLPEIVLEQGKEYSVSVQFLNESDPSDVEDITEEVIAEKDEHFVFYDASASNGLAISSGSQDVIDSDNIGINIATNWVISQAATSGKVRVYLIHEPTQKTGTARGDFGGETDIEVDFDITIQ